MSHLSFQELPGYPYDLWRLQLTWPGPPPWQDEWGLPIEYKAIIVNGGDNPEQTIVQEAADTMETALGGQGYDRFNHFLI